MYQISDWSLSAPDHHGYPRVPDLIKQNASSGKPKHQCSGTPGRPFLHPFRFLSQTSAGQLIAELHGHFSVSGAVPLFDQAIVPSPRPVLSLRQRAEPLSRLAFGHAPWP
jgi:hypothetical protein